MFRGKNYAYKKLLHAYTHTHTQIMIIHTHTLMLIIHTYDVIIYKGTICGLQIADEEWLTPSLLV